MSRGALIARVRGAVAGLTALSALAWVQTVGAQPITLQPPVRLNGVEVIGVSDTGNVRPSVLLVAAEPVGVGDVGTVTGQNRPPTANAGGPYTVAMGGSVELTGSGSDPDGDALTFAWDLNNDGTFETAGQRVTVQANGLTPGTLTVVLQVCDSHAACATAATSVEVTGFVGGGGGGGGGGSDPSATPELGSIALFASGAVGVLGPILARRRRKNSP